MIQMSLLLWFGASSWRGFPASPGRGLRRATRRLILETEDLGQEEILAPLSVVTTARPWH
jgi:hypothetical protein